MDVIRCPYLGMSDDPDTRLDFPSPGNVCHKAAPPGPIMLDYQQRTCLTEQHVSCPVYTAAHAVPLPQDILAPSPRNGITRPAMPAINRPMALVLIVLLAVLLFGGAVLLGNPSQSSANQSNGGQNNLRPGLFSLPETGSNRLSATPNPTIIQLRTNCPPPDGWVPYTVNPTDSLYRLSVVHRVPVERLQQANCMGDETVILPGQVIYIPFTPTATPTVTPTRVLQAATRTSPPNDDGPGPVNPPTDEPPTDAPPSPAPTTAVPPTAAVPTQAATTAVPPTAGVPTVSLPTVTIPTLPLPTVVLTLLPIIDPTATQAPPEAPDPGDDGNNNRSETIDCGGGWVTVDGNNNDVTLTGTCLGLTVTGNNNHVSVPAGTPVQDRGKNNVIEEG